MAWSKVGNLLHLLTYTPAARPAASSFAAGAGIFDTALKRPLWTDGSKWHTARQVADPLSGAYYWCNSAGNSANNVTGGFGVLRVTPWQVETPTTLAKLFAEVTNAGGAATTIRLAVYADNGNGQPGALVFDSGASGGPVLDGTSASVQELTAALTLQPGLYWVGGVPQGSGTQPGVRGVGAGIIDCDWGVPLGTSLPAAGTNVYGYQRTGVTGALPDPFGSTTVTAAAIRIGFKVA